MSHTMNRRDFLHAGTAAATAAALAPAALAKPPERADRIRLAVIGVAGQGEYNLNNVAHEEIVALCDVDTGRAAAARRRFPRATFHQDYRRVLDQNNVDAVVVSTPDHTHAAIAAAALRAGKHVYCEKPLTHSVHEARTIIDLAARNNRLKTQMGTQIHAGDNYRRVVELVRGGAIGTIRRVKVWCARRPDGMTRARERADVPDGFNYDLWQGPAPERPWPPFARGGNPVPHFDWRWWWDYGGGVLADMGCHFMDLPHWALDLRTPTSVRATGRQTHRGDNDVPTVLQVDYEYPARRNAPPVHLTWYHGVSGPDLEGRQTIRGFANGVLFEGERGQLVADYGNHRLMPEDRFRNFERPAQSIPRSVGHHREWLEAIRNNGTTTCNFGYSGPLTVSVLLGNVAYRAGERLQWDDQNGRVTNTRNADQYLRREYRRGWTL